MTSKIRKTNGQMVHQNTGIPVIVVLNRNTNNFNFASFVQVNDAKLGLKWISCHNTPFWVTGYVNFVGGVQLYYGL